MVHAPPPYEATKGDGRMNISILPCEWGTGRHDDIQRLLMDTASHINRELRVPFAGHIRVGRYLNEPTPKIYYLQSPDQSYRDINLTVKDCRWNQYAYQFAHEFCHVIMGPERLRDNPNNWLHESFCELASLYTLRRMGERWLYNPPYPHWRSYSSFLTSYANERLDRASTIVPSDTDFRAWLSSKEGELRDCPLLRDYNLAVTAQLLPLMESDPTRGWNATTRLPCSESMLKEYLSLWRLDVGAIDRVFVQRISRELIGADV